MARMLCAICVALLSHLPLQAAVLQRATLSVADLDESIAFYCDLLGFTVASAADYETPAFRAMFNIPPEVTPRLVLLDGADQPRALALVSAPGLVVNAEANTLHAPALVIATRDIHAMDAKLREAGTTVVFPPTILRAFNGSVIGTEAMYLDPDGVRVVLMDYSIPTRQNN